MTKYVYPAVFTQEAEKLNFNFSQILQEALELKLKKYI